MANKDFVVKNGIVVNGTANVTSDAVFNANLTVIGSILGTTSSANNATYVGGNTATTLRAYSDTMAATAYSNAINISANATTITTGTLNTARLPATANITTALNVGSNINITTSNITVGNSTVKSFINSSSITTNGSLTVYGTDNTDSLLVYRTGSVKFVTIKPETSANTTQFGYYDSTGGSSGFRTIELPGPTKLSSNLIYGGVTLNNSVTGTGSMVLSDSAALTGTPTAPTLTSTDSSTKIATTAFVQSVQSTQKPVWFTRFQQISWTGSGLYKLLFATPDFDTGSYLNTSTNRLVPAVGYYNIQASFGVFSGTSTDCLIYIYKNGVNILSSAMSSTIGSTLAPVISSTVYANGTDYFEVYFYAANIQSYVDPAYNSFLSGSKI